MTISDPLASEALSFFPVDTALAPNFAITVGEGKRSYPGIPQEFR